MRSGSLALRLTVSAALWSAVALAAAGLLLSELYRSSIERSFDARLTVYQKTLAGIVAATPKGEAPDVGGLGEPRFLLPLTGWYYVVRDAASGATVATSRSLYGEVLDVPEPPRDGTVSAAYLEGPSGAALRMVLQRVRLGDGRRYDLAVTGNADDLNADVADFRLKVFATLAVFAAGLLAATVLQVRLALRPLGTLARALADIREGRATRLEAALPREIAPLGQELNALIETNGAIVERARAHVGNLAHALKTPLSVLLNEARAEGGPLGAKVVEQASAMRGEVDRYLERARTAAGRRAVGSTTEALAPLERLATVLARAYPTKDLDIDVEAPADLRLRLDRRDVEELVGNLMDNAAKFGRGRIRVRAAADPAASERPMAVLTVEDDGPGLSPDSYAHVLGRGRRLDETVPGSGLGLSIADEIVEAAGGRMTLGRSELGGLAVTLRLPRS